MAFTMTREQAQKIIADAQAGLAQFGLGGGNWTPDQLASLGLPVEGIDYPTAQAAGPFGTGPAAGLTQLPAGTQSPGSTLWNSATGQLFSMTGGSPLAPPPPANLPPVNLPTSTPVLPPISQAPSAPAPSPAPSAMPPINPLAILSNLQSQAAPGMANPVAGGLPSSNQMATMPQVTPLDAGIPSPLSPLAPTAGGAPNALPGNAQPGPVQTQTLGESVSGQLPSNAPPAGTPGLAASGGDGVGVAPGLTPPVDEGPQAIPFRPNNPTPASPTLGPNASIEDFMGSLGGLQFGPGGILGAPGGPRRAAGQSEADFMRSLLSQGLFGGQL